MLQTLKNMDTKITDVCIAVLGTAVPFQDHAGIFITVIGFVVITTIRIVGAVQNWQKHRQEMKNLKLDQKIKESKMRTS